MRPVERDRTAEEEGESPVMRAAVLYGPGDVRLEEIPVPGLQPGEVLVEVQAALTDGTDLKVFRRGYHAKMIRPPAVFGHEYAGQIAAVGPGVEGWKASDRVVGANSAPCGVCFHCQRSELELCEDLVFVNGAYAPYLRLSERLVRRNLLRIPDGLPAAKAAVTEPLACVIKGVRDLGVKAGEEVAVIGSGPIGLMAARVAVLAGARVIILGRRRPQLEIAERWGASEVIGPDLEGSLSVRLQHSNSGRGPDRVFEATGLPAIWEEAMASVRQGGTVNLFGGCPAGTRVSFDTNRVHYGEIRICSSFHHTPEYIRQALAMIASGDLDPAPLFDSEESLDQLPRVLDEMHRRVRTLKTIIRP